MRISYQNETLFPGKPDRIFGGAQLYHHYEQSQQTLVPGLHWFDFQTNVGHTLNVSYPSSFYKMVLCIAGESRSVPRNSAEYRFRAGQGLFYRTEQEPYKATLPADTQFKVIHIHLSEANTALLERDMPVVFERKMPAMKLSADCSNAFLQLKNLSRENPGLLRLFEEKLITDQLFSLAVHALAGPPAGRTRTHARDLLQEAIWHIQRADRYLTIAELSKMVGTNTFHLKQLFREQMRTSVFQYQSDLRLEHAAALLLDTALDITQIALQCGYESTAAFSNAFLRKHGARPSVFKSSRSRK